MSLCAAAVLAAGCHSGGSGNDAGGQDAGGGGDAGAGSDLGFPQVSRSIALSADGKSLWVVNPESDSISQIDVGSQTLKQEVLLGATTPTVDPVSGRYEPAVRPRALALIDSLNRVYVAAQAANAVYDVSTTQLTITKIPVGAEPVAVVASADGKFIYVVNHQSATVQKIDTGSDSVVGTLPVTEHPWGASLRADGSALYVSHMFLNPGVTVVDTASFTQRAFTAFPDQPQDPTQNKLIPSGKPRVEYTVVPRPNDGELWVLHLILNTNTVQPALDFQSSVFPTISRLKPGGQELDDRLLFKPGTVAGATGAFTDSVSGPHDVAFTPDGTLALVALAQSEDVMIFDAATGFELGLVRPVTTDLTNLPVGLIEGVVIDASGTHAYLQGRSTHNVSVLNIAEAGGTPNITVAGPPIECLQNGDPMPHTPPTTDAGVPDMRHGMRLFYSANSAAFPITTNFWIACASCHPEGGSDAVTWQFAQGPRDTPSNVGGPINTGFLFRQADRNTVLQYDETIRNEQGGRYTFDGGSASEIADLLALTGFTNYAIPYPQNPNLAPGGLTAQQQHGQTLFQTNCSSCHLGAYFTDSGLNNPALNLAGPVDTTCTQAGSVCLHDIGTCVTTGAHTDQSSQDDDGDTRQPCLFDTPTLRSIFASAPYFHDGSAVTLADAVARVPFSAALSASDQSDLVAYLLTL